MSFIIVGLGNPGEEYEGTRHNTGRSMLYAFAKSIGAGETGATSDFKLDKKLRALVVKGEVGSGKKKEAVVLVAPETFMNKSGISVGPLVTTGATNDARGVTGDVKANIKKAEKLIVIYDDFNLPLGSIRVSFNRSSGGHNGLESVIRAVKTPAFVRVRVGVAPEKANGTAKVPHGEKEIEKFILSPFKSTEAVELKKVSKLVIGAIETIITESREKAMSIYNAG
jgi:PTH1 family peptidyl-tRNA hydrolase